MLKCDDGVNPGKIYLKATFKHTRHNGDVTSKQSEEEKDFLGAFRRKRCGLYAYTKHFLNDICFIFPYNFQSLEIIARSIFCSPLL